MAKKIKLIEDLLIISIIIVIGFDAYRAITLSGSPNFPKEFLGSLATFATLSGADYLVLYTIYYSSKRSAQKHNMTRSLEAGAIMKRVLDFMMRMLVPFAIALTALMTIYFIPIFIIFVYILMVSRSLTLFTTFIFIVLMYVTMMYYSIWVLRYKKARMAISTS